MTLPPTDHQLAGAVHVARLIDAGGNPIRDARAAYRHAVTHGLHPYLELEDAEDTLTQAGLLIVTDGTIHPTPGLRELAALPDMDTCVALLRAILDAAATADARTEAGLAGERHVVTEARRELNALGRPDLSRQVAQVSLISDRFGFDVRAPHLTDDPRLLEVKTYTSSRPTPVAVFHLTRYEWQVGLASPRHWALVVCHRGPVDQVDVIGWCRAATLEAYLPADRQGHWTEARLQVPAHRLIAGLPPPI